MFKSAKQTGDVEIKELHRRMILTSMREKGANFISSKKRGKTLSTEGDDIVQ